MTGIDQIAAERERQITEEFWAPEHDDQHAAGELAKAAECYLHAARSKVVREAGLSPDSWPFEEEWWKPSADPVRNLVKAGALIAAEIDRLERVKTLMAQGG